MLFPTRAKHDRAKHDRIDGALFHDRLEHHFDETHRLGAHHRVSAIKAKHRETQGARHLVASSRSLDADRARRTLQESLDGNPTRLLVHFVNEDEIVLSGVFDHKGRIGLSATQGSGVHTGRAPSVGARPARRPFAPTAAPQRTPDSNARVFAETNDAFVRRVRRLFSDRGHRDCGFPYCLLQVYS